MTLEWLQSYYICRELNDCTLYMAMENQAMCRVGSHCRGVGEYIVKKGSVRKKKRSGNFSL